MVMLLGMNMYTNVTHMLMVAGERQKQLRYYYLNRALLEYAKSYLHTENNESDYNDANKKELVVNPWPFDGDGAVQGRVIIKRENGTVFISTYIESSDKVLNTLETCIINPQ
jgi:hypothetical protein